MSFPDNNQSENIQKNDNNEKNPKNIPHEESENKLSSELDELIIDKKKIGRTKR